MRKFLIGLLLMGVFAVNTFAGNENSLDRRIVEHNANMLFSVAFATIYGEGIEASQASEMALKIKKSYFKSEFENLENIEKYGEVEALRIRAEKRRENIKALDLAKELAREYSRE